MVTGGDQVNILVVDDSADNRLTLHSILSEPGQHVVTASSGRDALRRLLEQEFAVILLDVNMPGMDGFETASLVRQRKSSERTPIIFITAFSDETHVSRGYSLGAVDYMVSPVVPEVLRSKVAVFVELFRKTEQIRRQAESLRRRANQLYHLTEASLAINSANTLDEILEIVTETARDLLLPRCALITTVLEQAHRPACPAVFSEDAAGECDERRFVAQAAAVTSALADQSRAVLIRAREVASDPRWEVLQDHPAAAGTAGAAGVVGMAGTARAAGTAGVAGAAEAEARAHSCGAASSGWLAAPLTGRDGRSFGWVHLAGRSRPDSGIGAAGAEFGDEDRTILTQLAQVASIAIENTLSSEAREANRLKDEFLTTLSHELRTPLTAILGWTRVLRTGPGDPARFAHGLEVIERNVTAQTKLIEDLLDVSRIIAGKLRVNLRPIPLLASIETAIEAMRPAAEAKRVALRLLISPDVGQQASIAGDADRLQQVGWNLVSNAIKFTPSGGHIEVTVTRGAETFRIRVTDTGKGISPQFLRHVFDRFRQDDSSSTRAHSGLGIGLAIVQHIVELHGGKVEAESRGPNLGASFTVTLPALPDGAAAVAAPEQPVQSSKAVEAVEASLGETDSALRSPIGADSALRSPLGAGITLGRGPGQDAAAEPAPVLRVLVVDDEPDTREILSEILRAAGATVATAGSLAETLALFDNFQPELLISDIAMPGGDGYALIRQLRRRGPRRGAAVPAIAVSAHAREEDRRRALAAGFELYLTKPVEPADLLAAVRAIAPARSGAAPGAVPPPPPVDEGAAGGGRAAAHDEAAIPAGAGAGAGPAAGRAGGPSVRAARRRGGSPPAAAGNNGGGAATAGVSGGGSEGVALDPGTAGQAGGRRILLVEDDADTREALKTLLELSGHRVEVAADGGEAVAHVLANRPDVALVDIGLPEIDGNEVARRIRAHLGAAGIFLVALTGYGDETDEARSRAAGFDAHFTKPVELARLERLLRASARAAEAGDIGDIGDIGD